MQSDTIILVKYTLTYMGKKSSLTRIYLKSPWYNKSCIKTLLILEYDRTYYANQLLKNLMNDAKVTGILIQIPHNIQKINEETS